MGHSQDKNTPESLLRAYKSVLRLLDVFRMLSADQIIRLLPDTPPKIINAAVQDLLYDKRIWRFNRKILSSKKTGSMDVDAMLTYWVCQQFSGFDPKSAVRDDQTGTVQFKSDGNRCAVVIASYSDAGSVSHRILDSELDTEGMTILFTCLADQDHPLEQISERITPPANAGYILLEITLKDSLLKRPDIQLYVPEQEQPDEDAAE